MGSASDAKHKIRSVAPVNLHLPLSGLNDFNTTCKVTNRIDIDKYFEELKKSYEPRSPRRVLRKSISSSKIEVSNSISSSRKKRILQKRRSIGEISAIDKEDEEAIPSPRQTAGYFNYDVSKGHIVNGDTHGDDDCLISRQKSLDLSLSKLKQSQSYLGCDDSDDDGVEDGMDLTASYSEGDFRGGFISNKMIQSRSCSFLSDLGERHKEHAMLHGKIDSVSERSRRTRHKYYQKDRKNSNEKSRRHSSEDVDSKSSVGNYEENITKLVGGINLEN